jgi:hypothetical protein
MSQEIVLVQLFGLATLLEMTNNVLRIRKLEFRGLCGLAGNGKAIALIALVQGNQGRQEENCQKMKQHRSASCILVLTTATPCALMQTVRLSEGS